MDSAPLTVSIVTVTFNSAATLADTLASVAGQRYPQVEHVLVDGGSTDGTLELIQAAARSAPHRVRWVSEPDEGIYDAMNKGIAMASGEVIGILNSDDFLADDSVVADIVERMVRTGADAVYADLVFVDQLATDQVQRVWRAGSGRVGLGWSPPHPTLYVRAEAYRRLGPYRTDFAISADYDFMLRLFDRRTASTVSYLDRTVVRMRNGGVSTRNLSGNIVGFREAHRSLRDARVRPAVLVNTLRVLRKFRQLRPA
jgi:glycosyltransferase involved in cell wall biosynthesis